MINKKWQDFKVLTFTDDDLLVKSAKAQFVRFSRDYPDLFIIDIKYSTTSNRNGSVIESIMVIYENIDDK